MSRDIAPKNNISPKVLTGEILQPLPEKIPSKHGAGFIFLPPGSDTTPDIDITVIDGEVIKPIENKT